jgi:predicted phage-related endonuclease
MKIDLNADYGELHDKEVRQAIAAEQVVHLDITNLPIEVAYANIAEADYDTFIKVRRDGFGGSDSSVLLGVNPYKTREELIQEKISTTVSEEERAIGQKVAVRKGKDLEPLIIEKFQRVFKMPTLKPVDMYRFKEYPYLTMNFDGVTGSPEQYIPTEIKVVTVYGEKHYDFSKAMYREDVGSFLPLPEDVTKNNWSVENKAAHYGVPPYYYTQVQQEMMALNAPFGHLSVLTDRTWMMYTFYIHRDEMVQREIILQGYKLWNVIQKAKAENVSSLKIETRENDVVDYMKEHHVNFAMASNATPIIQPEYVNIKEKKIND